MGVIFENLDLKHDACWWKGGTGVMTVPIDVPGDLVGLGFSAQVRARGEKDRVRVGGQHRRRQDLARGRRHRRPDPGPDRARPRRPSGRRASGTSCSGSSDGQQHDRRPELPGRRRLPRPARRQGDPPVPGRSSLERRRPRPHHVETITQPAGDVHHRRRGRARDGVGQLRDARGPLNLLGAPLESRLQAESTIIRAPREPIPVGGFVGWVQPTEGKPRRSRWVAPTLLR